MAGRLAAVTTETSLTPARARDAVGGAAPSLIAEPREPDELARVLAAAADLELAVVPRGGGTKLAWGSTPRALDLVLSTRRLDAVLEHAAGDLTVTVQAGCTFGHLQQTVAAHRQRLALDPLFPASATIGGVLATNDSGSLRAAFGSARDQLIGITVALADGRTARSGGRVVKNVAGYDLPKLFIGSFGTLGVITEATFRLYPHPPESATLTFRFANEQAVSSFLRAVTSSTLAATGVQVQVAGSGACKAAVRLEGLTAHSVHDRERRLREIARSAGAAADGEPDDLAWQARERLYADNSADVVAKFTFLPSELSALLNDLRRRRDPISWELVAQAIGVGDIRFGGRDPDSSPSAGELARALREVAESVRRRGGSFVVRQAPPALRSSLDVWGPAGDALPLMRRVKERFDPSGTLSPGRFVGGI